MLNPSGAAALVTEAYRPGTVRGVAGFFRAAEDATGKWWLIRPGELPVFLRAVHGVRPAANAPDGELARDSAARLREWGFNAVGIVRGENAAGLDDGLPFMGNVGFCEAGPLIEGPGVRLPDVFDPDWSRFAHRRAAEICTPQSATRELVGWLTDDRPAWAQPSLAGRPPLLQLCLSLEPSAPAYHASWEFVLALHGGRLESLAQAWNTRVNNKEVVRELTRAEEGLGTRGYLRDDARWTREVARRYFSTAAAAIRAADPNHLILGCRFGQPVGPHVLAECGYPAVDVGLVDWTELPPPGASPSQPVIASDVNWTTAEFLRPAAGGRERRLTSLERMLHRARVALDRMAGHPAVVGYAWSQWQDEPGEQPPFARGVLHANGSEAREHTELLAEYNRRVEALRRSAPSRFSS